MRTAGDTNAAAFVSCLSLASLLCPADFLSGFVKTLVKSNRTVCERQEHIYAGTSVLFRCVHLTKLYGIHIKGLSHFINSGLNYSCTLRCTEALESACGLLIGINRESQIVHIAYIICKGCTANAANTEKLNAESTVSAGI